MLDRDHIALEAINNQRRRRDVVDTQGGDGRMTSTPDTPNMTDAHIEAIGCCIGEPPLYPHEERLIEVAALVRSLRDGTLVVVDVDDLSELDALLVRAKLTTENPSPTRDHARSALAIVRGWLSRQPSQQAPEKK